MNSSRFSPEVYRSVIHPLMSVAVTAPGVLAAVYLVSEIAGLPNPSAVVVTAIVLAVIVEAVVGNLLYKERAGTLNRFRELVIYLTVIYIVLSLFRSGPVARRFVPDIDQIVPIIPVGFAWFIGYTIHDRLRGREGLLRSLADKKHDLLRRTVLDRQHDMALTIKELRSVKKLIVALFVMLGAVTCIGASGVIGTPGVTIVSPGFVLFAIFSIAATVVIGAINAFVDEYASNGEGVTVTARFRRRRALAAGILVAIIVVLAFSLSRNTSLLPLDAFGRFFAWLGGLFDRRASGAVMLNETPDSSPIPSSEQLRNLLAQIEVPMPPLWLQFVVRLLRRLIAAVLVAAVVLFIFGPLFSPSFRNGLKKLRPGKFLKTVWRRFVQRLRVLWRALRSGAWFRWRKGDDTDEDEKPSRYGDADTYRPSIRKRRQMDRVVTVFLAVARWGDAHGLRYARSLTAREYLTRIPELYPERYIDSQIVLETFHEARFSRRLVSFTGMREYVQAAKRITRG